MIQGAKCQIKGAGPNINVAHALGAGEGGGLLIQATQIISGWFPVCIMYMYTIKMFNY